MYRLLLITLLSTYLNAQNPLPYAALGDVIYDNVEKIDSLKKISSYELYKDDIDNYTTAVYEAKEEGYRVEKSGTNSQKREYLNTLRKLSKENDYFLRSIKAQYKESLNKNNYDLFSEIINSGLIDTKSKKEEIIDYYYKNKEDMNSSGVIDEFLEEDARLKAKKEIQKKRYKSKKQLEEEKIRRIRQSDLKAQKELEKNLQNDLNNKKADIRKYQKQELEN